MARAFDRAEDEVNHSLQELKTSVGALSCSKTDRAENERNYLESALKILHEMTEISDDEIYEGVTVEVMEVQDKLEKERVEVNEWKEEMVDVGREVSWPCCCDIYKFEFYEADALVVWECS